MYSYNEILNRMLQRVPDTFDKRQGSIIYDALAPAAIELAEMYSYYTFLKGQTYLLTANGESLDLRGADWGMARLQATPAQRIIEIHDKVEDPGDVLVIELGSRISAPMQGGHMTFMAMRMLEPVSGEPLRYVVQAEQEGIRGNNYFGTVFPLFSNSRLARIEIVGTYLAGTDVETDEHFRQRILERIIQRAFGGNIADYSRFAKNIMISNAFVVGAVKVYPVWDGGGSVLLSVASPAYDPLPTDVVNAIKEQIDPVGDDTQGRGYGIAPIGHTVTVTTPIPLDITIEARIVGLTPEQAQSIVEASLLNYLQSLRSEWGSSKNLVLTIYGVAQAIGNAHPSITNVTNVLISGQAEDITIQNDPTPGGQQLPYLKAAVPGSGRSYEVVLTN